MEATARKAATKRLSSVINRFAVSFLLRGIPSPWYDHSAGACRPCRGAWTMRPVVPKGVVIRIGRKRGVLQNKPVNYRFGLNLKIGTKGARKGTKRGPKNAKTIAHSGVSS